MANIYLTCFGGVGTVTGANFMLEVDNKKILVDCGLLQGTENADEINRKPFEYDVSSVNYLFVTHAHADHIGLIPKLVKEGFGGKIYSTPATKEIAQIMYQDALGLMDKNSKLFDKEDVLKTFELWDTVLYHQNLKIDESLSFVFKDAGHILGSAMVEFKVGTERIVFTGDLGNSPDILLKDTEKLEDANYLIMESVYGDKNHESPQKRNENFKKAVKNTIQRGGTVLIPAFSLERTQAILYLLNEFVESGQLPSVPVFLDSPLAIKLTEIYKKIIKHYNQDVRNDIKSGDEIFNFPKLKMTRHSSQSKAIEKVKGPKIIIAGSGMSTGGRILHHEVDYLPSSKNTLLLVGHQSLGTLGREIQDGAKKVFINGQSVDVRAEIRSIDGFSSHKDGQNLLEFVADSKDALKKVFVTMGEPKASMFLIQRIRDYLDIPAVYPEPKKKYKLE